MPKRKIRDDSEKNICGAAIKRTRTVIGLTQTQLGELMEKQGVVWDQKTVSSVELQHRALCDYELKAVAKCLGTTVNALLEQR